MRTHINIGLNVGIRIHNIIRIIMRLFLNKNKSCTDMDSVAISVAAYEYVCSSGVL